MKKKEKVYYDDQINEVGKHLLTLDSYDELLTKTYYLYGKIPVYIKDLLGLNTLYSLENILLVVESKISEKLVSNLNAVWIGKFDQLESVNLDSVYRDKVIYLTNTFPSADKLYFSLIYEMNHVVAENFDIMLSADPFLRKEFLTKRIALYNKLTKAQKKRVNLDHFLDTKYNSSLFNFLFMKMKRSTLDKLCNGIFLHSNGVHSLYEYFSIAYYMYLVRLKSAAELEKSGPVVFTKIEMLTKYSKE